ncbi:MAG TPA: thioesterase family protein [Stellaceae bacterium]|nr:thioesterase family protein [Stellaceae bacterium]
MNSWIETYRGAASPWECDVTEHFTMAFYFDRIAMAEATLAAELGLLDMLRQGGFGWRCNVRLARELRSGSAFHIESGIIGTGDGPHFGHRVVNSATGEPTTWFDIHWDMSDARLRREPAAEWWDGPHFPERSDPVDLAGLIPSMAGRVQPGDLDQFGRMGLAGMVHKFSDAAVQFGAAIGLTADYIKTGRRSFSAFELRVRIAHFPRLSEAYRIDTGLAHLGNTSLRYLHLMRDAATGEEIARVDRYGVQLDLDARRPAPLAPALRAKAERLLLPMQ